MIDIKLIRENKIEGDILYENYFDKKKDNF